MNPFLEYLAAFPVQANFYRRAGVDHPIDALVAAVTASAAHGLILGPHRPGPHLDVSDPAWWRAQFRSEDPFKQSYGGALLSTAMEPIVNARYNRELMGLEMRHARLRVDLPERGVFSDDAALATWVGAVADAYGSAIAWVHTEDLLDVVRSLKLPDDGMRSTWINGLDADTRAKFAAFPAESVHDWCDIPEAVWWINVWSAETVRKLDENMIARLGWHRREHLTSGSWLLVATAERPDRAHPTAIAHIAALADALGLANLQRHDPQARA